jgi:Fur family ferric uptake transcriptional regulator
METQLEQILRESNVGNTASRRTILELFLDQDGALAHSDIEEMMGGGLDRVTVYRTLQTFLEKGLIHTIPTSDNSIRYALCKGDCSEGHHHDNHVHFMCDECSNAICLDKVATPAIRLPRGFKGKHVNVVVSGTCKDCKAAAQKKSRKRRKLSK